MSVDKFGRYATSGKSKVVRGPKGEGFVLNADGDYDIQRKRLKLVNNPLDELDAVNLKSLRENSISLNRDGVYDAGNKRITNVSAPQVDTDCVNIAYFKRKTPLQHKSKPSYSFHQYNIKDVAYPVDDGDAVNLTFVKNNCPLFDTGKVDFKGYVLSQVRDPIKGSDGATKTYVDSKGPYSTKTYWTFSNKRLVSVGDPKDLNDAVTVRYMNDNSLCKLGNGIKQFDGKAHTISNIANPLQLDDAVNKRYLKQVLADLGYAIYSNIHKGRSSLTPADQWKSQVLDNSTWDNLFK